MPRKAGGTRRKRRTHLKPTSGGASPSPTAVPRSFVLRRGAVPTGIRDLVTDLRQTLMPHTARHLRERKSNNIRDYVSVSAQLGVSHMWLLSATARAPYLRMATMPQGPTLTFRIREYSLMRHIRATQRRPHVMQAGDVGQPPVLVLNQFAGGGKEVKLVAETLRHSFPALDVGEARLDGLRRVLLVDREEGSGVVRMRHYAVKVQAAGLSRPVRKMISKRRVPKLAKLTDVAEVMEGGGQGVFSSDSEMEGDAMGRVRLGQAVKHLKKGANSRVRLVELGPRVTLELVKIQGGMCDGAVLFHGLVQKSEEEAEVDRRRIEEKAKAKRKRKEEQDRNVKRKMDKKKDKKERHKRNIEARLKAEEEAKEREERELELEKMNDEDDDGQDSASSSSEDSSEESSESE